MKTLQLTGHVDTNGQLHAEVPPETAPGAVKLLLLVPNDEDDEMSDVWVRGVSKEWASELADTREDIYTLEDGKPLDGQNRDNSSNNIARFLGKLSPPALTEVQNRLRILLKL